MPSRKENRKLKALKLREDKLRQILERLMQEPGTELTQEEVALIGNTTRHQIRRIEARAILKLRHRTLHLSRSNQP